MYAAYWLLQNALTKSESSILESRELLYLNIGVNNIQRPRFLTSKQMQVTIIFWFVDMARCLGKLQ